MRTGRKTSEFWVTMGYNLFGLLSLIGVLPIHIDPEAIMGSMGIATGVYAGARGLAKRNGG